MKNSTLFFAVILMLLALTSCNNNGFEVRELHKYVNPRIGTDEPGNTVIGPQVPWGSINPSPDTPHGSTDGYDPGEPIRGFSQTHVSGTGGWSKYGNFLISPQTGINVFEEGHDSPKENEKVSCGYYGVHLSRYGIDCEVTPTHHAALYNFTFPESDEAHILFDLGHNIPQDICNDSKALSSILVDDSDATESDLTKFYTALYHTMIMPRDRTGDSPWGSEAPYWDDHYCIWDTYRSSFPLWMIIKESMVRDNLLSFIERFDHYGTLTDTYIAGQDGVEQGGNNTDVVIAEAYLKDVPGVNWEEAYDILKHSAEHRRSKTYRENDRGWVPKGTVDQGSRPCVSKGLEFNYNDFCVAQMAEELGKTTDYKEYLDRSQKWVENWSPSVESDGFKGFMRGRNLDGSWCDIDPKETAGWGHPYFYEASSWIYSFYVPHNFHALIDTMGGDERFVERVKHYHESGYHDWGNEPSFLNCHLFHYAGKPYLSSNYMRKGLRAFHNGGKLIGNEDSGAMSAWYLFNAMGFFPVAGQDLYLIHGPRFEKITLQMGNGNDFIIEGINASDKNKYVQSVELNGEEWNKTWFKHTTDLKPGGVMRFEMGPEPSDWGKGSVLPGTELDK